MGDIRTIVSRMEPEQAITAIAGVLKELFPLVGEEARINFVVNLVGESGDDKVSSLVHL